MKRKKCAILILFITMLILVSACGSGEQGGKKYYGTWKATQVEIEGSVFTVDELEAVGDDSVSDAYIIIKEGGKAYLHDRYDSDLMDWSVAENGIKIEDLTFEYKNRTLSVILDDNKVIFEKVSSSQSLTDAKKKSDTKDKKADKNKTSKSDKGSSKTAKKTEETKQKKSEKAKQDKTGETEEKASSEDGAKEAEKEKASSGDIEKEAEKEKASSEDGAKEAEKEEKSEVSEPVGDFTAIVNNGNVKIEDIEAELRAEWEKLTASITDYASFVQNEEAVETFYETIEDRHVEMCTIAYQAALDYGKAIMASDDDWGARYDMAGKLENDIYDDMFDNVEDLIYDGLLDDMEEYLYDGVLKDDDEAGVPYGDWYDTRSDEYSRWYDCRSGVYSEWYDSRSDVYSFKYDLAGEFWSKDADGAQKTIDRFAKKVNKRLGS